MKISPGNRKRRRRPVVEGSKKDSSQPIHESNPPTAESLGETDDIKSALKAAAAILAQSVTQKAANPTASSSVAGALMDRKIKERARQSWKRSAAKTKSSSSAANSAQQSQAAPSSGPQRGATALKQIQQPTGTLPPGRKLTGAEIAGLRKIFGSSIDYSKVEIVEGNLGVLGTLSQGRAFTLGNTIYVPGNLQSRDPDGALLAHEAVHVWQYQSSGAGYIASSLLARATQGEQAAYSWQKDVDNGKPWHKLNSEQQGQLIGDAVKAGFFKKPGSRFIAPPPPSAGKDYTNYLNTVLGHIARGEGAP